MSIGVFGMIDDEISIRHFHHISQVKDHDAITHLLDDTHVVTDEDNGGAVFLL